MHDFVCEREYNHNKCMILNVRVKEWKYNSRENLPNLTHQSTKRKNEWELYIIFNTPS